MRSNDEKRILKQHADRIFIPASVVYIICVSYACIGRLRYNSHGQRTKRRFITVRVGEQRVYALPINYVVDHADIHVLLSYRKTFFLFYFSIHVLYGNHARPYYYARTIFRRCTLAHVAHTGTSKTRYRGVSITMRIAYIIVIVRAQKTGDRSARGHSLTPRGIAPVRPSLCFVLLKAVVVL